MSIAAIYVSHRSEKYINRFGPRHVNELGNEVIVANSSSEHLQISGDLAFELIELSSNIGFAAANNIAIQHALKKNPDFFLIINPDVYLPENWRKTVLDVLRDDQYKNAGIFTVPLLGYDFEQDGPTGLVDSLGIGNTWYGRWFDISQGDKESILNLEAEPYELSVACGALILLRKEVVLELLDKDGFVFNESFFMYKEDIELSIRVKRLGWKILMISSAPAYHCRGWASNRQCSPFWARKISARNELMMHLKYRQLFLPYSILKYLYVMTLERIVLGVKGGA